MAYCILKSYKLKIEPFKIFEILSQQKNCFLLDSSLNANYSLGRYSFLGIDPFFTLKTKGQDLFKKLREILEMYKIRLPKNNIPFLGGAVGYLTYDLGLILEKKIERKIKPDLGIPDFFFGFYNTVLIIDHFKKLFYICSLGFPERDYRLAKLLAESNFKKIYDLVYKINFDRHSQEINKSQASSEGRLNSSFTKEEYLLAIKKAKEYIKAGDIYQVNLSQEFKTRSSLSSYKIYRRLRKISPSYFSAYLDGQDFQVLSSSPERFLRLEGDIVTTRPMKGTRARSKNRLKDLRFKKNLLDSAKDKAELIMIVDLERNDLGKVCSYDSIKVSALRQLEEYSTVFQTTATVRGKLHKDKDRIDLLRACFPGGSITGCPKIRAMEIIEELEPNRRSVYTGCLGYLSFSGDMDFNILIRTILKKEDKLYFGVGGGIVTDSRPDDEYEETLVKARAMMEAIS
jgi:para-aminobenzoate synthetase component 1